MAQKGERKCQKRFAASKVRNFERKKYTWATKCKPGPHLAKESVPLAFVLTELLKVAENKKEAKVIISQGKVMVDLVVRKDERFPVGLFDIISFKGMDNAFQLIFDSKGRFVAKELKKDEAKTKLCKVLRKNAVKKGLIRIGTHDGRVFEGKKMDYAIGDTLKIALPEQKILERFELKNGAKVYIIRGSHVGEEGVVKEITKGNIKVPSLVTVEHEDKSFKTVAKNVMVIE